MNFALISIHSKIRQLGLYQGINNNKKQSSLVNVLLLKSCNEVHWGLKVLRNTYQGATIRKLL